MKLQHNGLVVIYNRTTTYWGGEYEYVDYYDYDIMSIVEFDAIIKKKLKYYVGVVYYLRLLRVEDMQLVETDKYLLKCLDRTMLITRVVEIYCYHPI